MRSSARTLPVALAVALGAALGFGTPPLLSDSYLSPPVDQCSPPVDRGSPPVDDGSPPVEVEDCSPPSVLVSYLTVWPPAFSPNGDGCLDTVAVQAGFSWPPAAPGDVLWWEVVVLGGGGRVVAGVWGTVPRPSVSLVWNGTELDGRPAPEGAYTVLAVAFLYRFSTGQSFEDSAQSATAVDLTPPAVTARQPAPEGVGVTLPGGAGAQVGATVTTEPEVRAAFSEPLDRSRSVLLVGATAGLPAQGFSSYSDRGSVLVFRAFRPGLAGSYQANAVAVDLACNRRTDTWRFTAVAPAP